MGLLCRGNKWIYRGNIVKTAIVALAISFALISCENDTLKEFETEKTKVEQIRPIDNHNDRELELEELKRLPLPKENKQTPNRHIQKEIEVMKEYIR